MMMVAVLLSAGSAFAIDQVAKEFVLRRLARGQFSVMGSLLRIRPVANSRRGRGRAPSRVAWLLLWGATVLSLVLVLQYGPLFQGLVAQLGLGAALGGATSNLVDRLKRGAVLDYIDVSFWPVFNLADVAIVLGVAIALCSLL